MANPGAGFPFVLKNDGSAKGLMDSTDQTMGLCYPYYCAGIYVLTVKFFTGRREAPELFVLHIIEKKYISRFEGSCLCQFELHFRFETLE